MSSRQPFPNISSSSHLPYGGSTIPNDTSLQLNIDLKPSFDTEISSHHLPPIPNHKRAPSTSELSLPFIDDGIEHEPNTDNNHIQPLVGRRCGSSFFLSLIPPSITCRLYLGVVLLETFIDLVIEGMILVRVQNITRNSEATSDGTVLIRSQLPVLLAIFCLAHVFQFAFALDAVHNQNVLQFIFLAIFNALFLVGVCVSLTVDCLSSRIVQAYSVMQIFEIQNTETSAQSEGISISTLTGAIPIVISIAQIAYMALGWRIYKEFGWNVYKQIGADRRIKKLYTQYQIFECLVRFDAFFWLGFSVQVSIAMNRSTIYPDAAHSSFLSFWKKGILNSTLQSRLCHYRCYFCWKDI